ncbi:hypothetical protein EW026_g3915 [Hermanssonia centrifuga]|uniref:Uncharacterized protein n=1 Tax=Hermanssonia centrifuga TaxID=98765 RepID=A0A4S4KJ62_9APHY|nr:hypothetical protein EW026_g3915 [Hermanssonia centrifuga]
MLHNLCQIGPQSSTAYPAYLNLCEDPTPSQGLAPLAWDANAGYNECMPYQWSQTHLDHIDRVDPQLEDLSTMLHGSCSIGSQPQIQTSMSEAHPTCLDDMGSFFTPRELGMLEGATPTSQMPPLLVSDVDARLNGCMPYQWSQTHLDHIDHVDPQLEDLSTMLHGSCSIGPQPQIQISMPEAHPTCLDDMGSFFTPRELGMLEGATTTSPMSPLLVSDVDARLNGCMPWSQTHPNHVDRIDPQFDENPWGSQQIAHHSTANYAPAPLRPPGPLPVQPTRVVAGIKHGTVIEQTPYQVTRQRRRNEQLRVKFFRSNGRPGIRLSQPEDLLDDKTEVSFVGGKGPKMSYRIRFPGGHNPINEQKNVTLRGPRRVLTHEKMVKQVIEVIIKFIEVRAPCRFTFDNDGN